MFKVVFLNMLKFYMSFGSWMYLPVYCMLYIYCHLHVLFAGTSTSDYKRSSSDTRSQFIMREILFGLFRLINDFKEKDLGLGEFSGAISHLHP